MASAQTEMDVVQSENNDAVPETQPESMEEHSDFYNKMLTARINPAGCAALDKLAVAGMITESDIDDRALAALAELSVEECEGVLAEFGKASLAHLTNKSAYLCGVMKNWRQRVRAGLDGLSSNANAVPAPAGGPDEAKLKAILDRTGYTLEVTTGQRKYGGPPPDWAGTQPGAGHVVFVGKLPKGAFEDELVPVFEKVGKLWDLRLMMDPATGLNKGYAFVTYCEKSSAVEAVKVINDHEIKQGWKIKVNASIANQRLFVGNILKNKTKEEIKEEFGKITEGILDVIVYAPANDPRKFNRGFCFLDYESHKAASAGRRKMFSGRHKVFGVDVFCDWADPMDDPGEEVMSKVKVLYVRNLVSSVTEEMLKEKFSEFGQVDRVKKVKDYGFIHFESRENALQAMSQLNGETMGDKDIEVTLAKPVDRSKRTPNRFEEFGGGRGGGSWGRGGPPMGVRGAGMGRGMRGTIGRGRGGGGMGRFAFPGGYGGRYGHMEEVDYYEEDMYRGAPYDHYGEEYMDYPMFAPRSAPAWATRGPPQMRGRGMRGTAVRGVTRMGRGATRGIRGIPSSVRGRGAIGGGAYPAPLMRASARGGPMRFRGADGVSAHRGSIKRSFDEGGRGSRRGVGGAAVTKRGRGAGGGDWGARPIAQQPLGDNGSEQWYKDDAAW